MKRMFILPLVALALTLPAAGQQAAAANDGAKPVAVINGEVITAARLDQLWNRVPPQVKDQYKNNGGKAAYLNNYLGKRLVIQEALKHGFEKRPDVVSDIEAAKESALFDRYVRDVVASSIVTDEEIKKYYDEHPDDFRVPEKIKVRHIVMVANPTMQNGKTKEQALELMKKISVELHADPAFRGSGDSEAAQLARVRRFAELAAHYSDDGAAQQGGDLGWVEKGMLDPDFEDAAFKLPLGVLSGIVETKYGYHIILVEQKKPAGMEPYDEAQANIREFLMSQHAAEVVSAVTKLTNDLRNASKVAVYPENIR